MHHEADAARKAHGWMVVSGKLTMPCLTRPCDPSTASLICGHLALHAGHSRSENSTMATGASPDPARSQTTTSLAPSSSRR
jgi:hypothetical protein